jgi:hypothetical protein
MVGQDSDRKLARNAIFLAEERVSSEYNELRRRD